MGHPLPTGQLPVSGELAWFLIAVPDNRQFIQAALAAYSALGSFWVWGAEGPVEPQSNDAADLFNEAINATLEAWEQNMLQQLIDAVDQVEPKLDALIACCDPTGGALQIPSIPPPATVGDITIWPIGNPDTMPPDVNDIVSPVGGVSASYPAIPDYDSSGTIGETEFFDYRCAGATFVLDTIINLLRWSAKAKRLVGDVADILSDLAFHIAGHYASGTPLGNILTILDATGAATWPLLLNATSATALETAASQVEAVKDTIRQELACGLTAAGALTLLQAALQSTITDAAALAFLTGSGIPGILVSMLWTATLDTGWSVDCTCAPTQTADFELGEFWAAPVAGVTITQLSPYRIRYQYNNPTAVRIQAVARAGMQTKLCATSPSGTLATEIRFSGTWARGDSLPSYDSKKAATAVATCPYNRQTGGTSSVTGTFLPGAIDITISNSQAISASYPTYAQTALLDNYATNVDIIIELVSMVQT